MKVAFLWEGQQRNIVYEFTKELKMRESGGGRGYWSEIYSIVQKDIKKTQNESMETTKTLNVCETLA